MGAIVMENKEMDRIKCTVAYDGMHFCGYQIQPQHRTVQQEIEKALQKLQRGTCPCSGIGQNRFYCSC